MLSSHVPVACFMYLPIFLGTPGIVAAALEAIWDTDLSDFTDLLVSSFSKGPCCSKQVTASSTGDIKQF